MTEVDASAFLDRFEASELAARGILKRRDTPAQQQERGPPENPHDRARRLPPGDRGGWLLADGTFQNPRAEGATSGNVDDLPNPGQVFNLQNTTLNPHFARGQATTAEDNGEFTFALERDLQKALRENIGQLEPGLADRPTAAPSRPSTPAASTSPRRCPTERSS